jgi:hypothetical protein
MNLTCIPFICCKSRFSARFRRIHFLLRRRVYTSDSRRTSVKARGKSPARVIDMLSFVGRRDGASLCLLSSVFFSLWRCIDFIMSDRRVCEVTTCVLLIVLDEIPHHFASSNLISPSRNLEMSFQSSISRGFGVHCPICISSNSVWNSLYSPFSMSESTGGLFYGSKHPRRLRL